MQQGDYVKYENFGGAGGTQDGTTIYGIVDAPVDGQPEHMVRVIELAALGFWGHGFSPHITTLDEAQLRKVELQDEINEIFPTVADLFITTVLFTQYEHDGSHYRLMVSPDPV